MSQVDKPLSGTDEADASASDAAQSGVQELKSQAAQAAETAKTSLNALAAEARAKVKDIVDGQVQAGADHVAGFARAAHSAAGELEDTNPTVARLVHDAASSVDQFAGSLRASDFRDVLSSVTTFARQQPVAFFAGSVLTGFVLARFLKSDAEVRRASTAPLREDEGYRAWSASHPDAASL